MLVVVSQSQEELLIVGIFRTQRELNLLKLLFEAAGGIAEALENTGDRRHGVPFVVCFPICCLSLFCLHIIVFGARLGRHQELVQIQAEGERMVVGQGEHEVHAETQVGGQKGVGDAIVIAHFRADIRYVETPRELALVAPDHRVGHKVSVDVGGKGMCRFEFFSRLCVLI